MSKCLVTSLKALVENENLNYLNYVSVFPLQSGYFIIKAFYDNAVTFKFLDCTVNGQTSITATSLALETNVLTPVVTGDNPRILIPMYSIKSLALQNVKVGQADFLCKNTVPLVGVTLGSVGNTNIENPKVDVTGINVSEFFLCNRNNGVFGDVTDVFANHTFKSVTLENCTGLRGSLDGLGKSIGREGCTFKTGLNINACYFEVQFENFVANARAAGVTEGSFAFRYSTHAKYKFNGQIYTNAWEESVTWTATTITYRGITIEA